MSMIDIIVAVDGAKLAQQIQDGSISAGSESSPTMLGAWSSSDVYICMISEHSFASNDQGGSELTIKANSGDSVRWTMTTFACNIDYTAYIYRGSFNPSNNITTPNFFNMHTSEYLPASQDPTATPSLFHNYTYVTMATVIEPGQQIQYTLAFALVDNSTGNTIGHFTWDPFINVSP